MDTTKTPNLLTITTAFAASLFAATSLMAAPPDLTNGGIPNNTRTTNLGPTGMRGWMYHVNGGGRVSDTSESRQILVSAVDNGSPAHGILLKDDVVLGAAGSGANPAPFSSNARKSLASAIADAEARNPATLKLLRWRSGITTTVEITLRTMGAYSATAPYNCPKSTQILTEGAQWVFNNETSGRYTFGAMSLLATGNPAYTTKVRNEARARVPNASTRTQMMSDNRDASSMITWERGHTLVFLAEYYLASGDSPATRDAQVLPGIEAYAVNIAKNSSLFGTVGHIFAEKNSDGSPNGPMGGVYGPVNSSGMPCFLGLLLARECGLTHPAIQPAIDRASLFFASYAGRGAIPYGEHEPSPSHEGNGRSGLAALCFTLMNNRVEAGKFFAKMATAAPSEREGGHTGAFFNYLWSPLGAATGGEAAAAEHFKRISWHLDLSRRWNGAFVYDCLNGEGPNSGATYNDFRMSTATLLVYALPLRHLHVTGRGHDPARWLSADDVAEAAAGDDYLLPSRTVTQLISDTGSWSPKIRRQAAIELKTRGVSTAQRQQLEAIATNDNLPVHARAGACDALGRIANSASATVLASLLNHPENYIRYASAEALRYLPNTARQSVLQQVLVATAASAKPWWPIDEEDPLQFAHGRLAVLLFYGGSAYGPKGIIWNNLSGVDRTLLYPAIRATAGSPLGFTRNNLQWTYPMLTHAETLAVSNAVVDSVLEFAPSDRMFAFSVRQKGFELLEKFSIAEGIPAGLKYMVETKAGDRTGALRTLEKYAASYTNITPVPDVIGKVTPFLNATGGNATQNQSVSQAAQDVLDAIAADINPRTLAPLKSIHAVVADDPKLTMPGNTTTLRVTSFDHAQGDSLFTWRKVSGPGNVIFTPNGIAAAANSTVQFDGTAGIYQFEVTMSDSREITEVSATVSMELTGETDTTPPTPDPSTFASAPAAISDTAISMTATTASDPSGPVGYFFTETSGNPGGADSGWQTSPSYTNTGLQPGTQYSYTVMVRDSSPNQNTTAASAPATAMTTGTAPRAPLKIYIFAGQSNMEGHGEMGPIGTQGTLDYLVANNPSVYGHLKNGANWAVRDDAWIWYKRGGTTLLKGGISAGYGALTTTIGPELQFGHAMGDMQSGPILIIKTAWGGKSLAVDFRPPSSGWAVNPPAVVGDQGYYYKEILAHVNDVLTNLPTYFPAYNPADGYELAGFGWHQGWNDRVTQAYNDEYEVNMKNFINDVRADLGKPNLPFVIATTGMTGWAETHPRALSLMAAQLAMKNFTKYPAFDGNVAVIDTRDFYREPAVSPNTSGNQAFHWNRNAETHFLIGQAMAQEMNVLDAEDDLDPPTPNPASFATAPTAISATQISMTATTGSDPSGPVQYLFTETTGNPGGASSAWQSNPSYTNSGLNPGTTYSYTVAMRDALGNTGAPSAAMSATTHVGLIAPQLSSIVDNVSGAPIVAPAVVIFTVTFNKAINPASIDPADFSNGDSAAVTIDSVTATGNPDVFEVAVNATGPGLLTLEIVAGATITDIDGTPLNTTTALADNTTITVNSAPAPPTGEITVNSFDFWKNQNTGEFTGTFDASRSDKLVVILTGEHGFNNAAGTVNSVTYDGVALTPVIQRNAQVATSDTIYNHIWILDNPGKSPGVVAVNVVNRGNVTVLGLSGTLPGAGATAISANGTRTVDLTTTATNSLVIASFGMGGAGNTANTQNVSVDSPLNFVSAQKNGNDWDGHVTGYAKIPTPGTGTYPFTGGNVSGAHVIAAEFLAAPAPAEAPYASWASINAPDGALNDDFDGDDVPNAIEFILGGDKDTNDSAKLPTLAVSDGDILFTFVRDRNSVGAGVNLAVVVSSNLLTWPDEYIVGADTASSSPGISVTDNLDGTDTITLTVNQALDDMKFARLKVSITP